MPREQRPGRPNPRPTSTGDKLGKRVARPIATPSTPARTVLHDIPESLTEVSVQRPGFSPIRVVVPTRDVTEDLIRGLERSVVDLPKLAMKPGQGAVDIALEGPEGEHIKSGTVVLEGASAPVAVPLDPASRRYRLGGLAPGEYRVRVASALGGRGSARIVVRDSDVTRSVVALDGSKIQGSTTVRFAIKGKNIDRVDVRGTDEQTGKEVFNSSVQVKNGIIEMVNVPFGRIHWDFGRPNDEKSCYDTETNDLGLLFDPPVVSLIPRLKPTPEPDPRFGGLPKEFEGIARVLPDLGIRSMDDLAAAEPEDLMHRWQRARGSIAPAHSRILGDAIYAARASLGVRAQDGEERNVLRLADGATFTRALLPRVAGPVDIDFDLDPGTRAEVTVQGPAGQERQVIEGAGRIRVHATPEQVEAKRAYQISVNNLSGKAMSGVMRAVLPTDKFVPGFHLGPTSVKATIESLLGSLAAQNSGLSVSIPDAVLAPENIQMWLDRARTFMDAAGVCSMNDLGRFRVNPMGILRTGAYVAPVVQPPDLSHIPVLHHYAFSDVLANSVLHYLPNDILHDAAVVLAGEWDIRGQTVIVGKEVRELVVIAGSVRYDSASRITWELPELPGANSYWPNPAPAGAPGNDWGANGADGADGDPNPHPSRNGGADAVVPGPIASFYILDATGGLPPIDLRGQNGGSGGVGQDGGRGGDGHTGLRADGTFFGGCCRGVGWGGNGGQGGDGGRGGKGGRGGQGGRVTILTTADSITALNAAPPSIDVSGGAGGPGGPPGNPGSGGFGGPAGSADCETWCDDHPERRGSDGAGGAAGVWGAEGDPSLALPDDAIQILPITPEQWLEEFNRPHILNIDPDSAEPGQEIQITGQNFDPTGDRVYFDGVNVGAVASGTQATFTVPLDSDGGLHPVVIRPAGVTSRRSNRVMLQVVPKLDEIPAGTRWVEGQNVKLTGLAFRPGLQVLAQDRSVSPAASYPLPVVGVTRTDIDLSIPGGPLGALRGVRRIVVRNPDNGASRDERVARISDTIVVRCAAFRVVGTTAGIGSLRSETDIANLFIEGAVNSISIPWGQARIAFRLVQPVSTITVADDIANLWPGLDNPTDTGIFGTNGVLGALNFFFVRDVDIATAYAYFGGGPLFIGDEGSAIGPVDFQQVIAHEVGHALCLRHICDGSGEGPGTFFNRSCGDADEAYLMYPFWGPSDGMTIHAGQVDPARIGASNFEDGKTASLPAASLFMLVNTSPQCAAADTQN